MKRVRLDSAPAKASGYVWHISLADDHGNDFVMQVMVSRSTKGVPTCLWLGYSRDDEVSIKFTVEEVGPSLNLYAELEHLNDSDEVYAAADLKSLLSRTKR